MRFAAFDPVNPDPLGDRFVHRVAWVQRPRRILEDHLHPAPEGAQTTLLLVDLLAVERDRSRRRPLEAEDRADQRRLATARLAHQRQHLAGPHVEGDAVDGAQRTPPRVERDLDIFESQQRIAHRATLAGWTCTQAACLPCVAVTRPMSRVVHASIARSQRGWKGQPDGRSAMLVLDARSWQEVGRAVLPYALPNGFHGCFVPS